MEKKALPSLARQIRGVSYKPEDIRASLDETSVTLLRANNISDGSINFDDIVFVDRKRVAKEQYLRRGDILICASSGSKNLVGKAAKVDFDGEYTFGAFCKVVRPLFAEDADYMSFFFQSPIYRRQISSLSMGININNIRNEHIDSFSINWPDIEQRMKIVCILNSVWSIIKSRQSELSALDALIKARFVEMFGEPIDNPMHWQMKPLKDLSTLITNGNTPKGGSENYVDDGIIFLRSQNVWRNIIDLSDVAYIDEATHLSMKKSSVHHNDILITKTGRINTENSSLGRAALYTGEDDSANINGHVYLVRLKDEMNPRFVVTILTGEAYRKYIRKVCVGGIDKRQINLDQVEDFPIIQPPIEEQIKFADFVEQIDKSKFAIQKSLEETQKLFDSMMQQYFG